MSDHFAANNPATLFFHGELQDFLRSNNRGNKATQSRNGVARVDYPVPRRASIKDVIERLGPPHTEIGAIELNGVNTDFTPLLSPGDTVAIRPNSWPMDVCSPTALRPEPLDAIRFLVDANIGRLSTLLRLLGFDTIFGKAWPDERVAEAAAAEKRIVLSKDRQLLKRSKIVFGRHIRARDHWAQLRETVRFYDLRPPYATFSRCLRCNDPLLPVAKKDILHRLEPLTRKYHNEFRICPSCGRVYWRGTHHRMMRERVAALWD